MGRFMAAELTVSEFFCDVDVIVPVPLHPRKQRMRGYNQSECVAKGVAAVTGIPLDAASVVRKKHTETQTSKSAYERWKNVNGIFHLRYPERFVGKHILLVDDVLTTGAHHYYVCRCVSGRRRCTYQRAERLLLRIFDKFRYFGKTGSFRICIKVCNLCTFLTE